MLMFLASCSGDDSNRTDVEFEVLDRSQTVAGEGFQNGANSSATKTCRNILEQAASTSMRTYNLSELLFGIGLKQLRFNLVKSR